MKSSSVSSAPSRNTAATAATLGSSSRVKRVGWYRFIAARRSFSVVIVSILR